MLAFEGLAFPLRQVQVFLRLGAQRPLVVSVMNCMTWWTNESLNGLNVGTNNVTAQFEPQTDEHYIIFDWLYWCVVECKIWRCFFPRQILHSRLQPCVELSTQRLRHFQIISSIKAQRPLEMSLRLCALFLFSSLIFLSFLMYKLLVK